MRFWIAPLFVTTLACSGPSQAPHSPAQSASGKAASETGTAGAEAAPFSTENPEAFTRWARSVLVQRLPQWSIQIADEPLLLVLSLGEAKLEVWLGRPFEYCSTDVEDCENNAREFVDSVAHAADATQADEPATAEQLLPAIRSQADVDTYSSRVEGLIVEPVGADLFIVYMLDTPKLAAPVSKTSIAELQLSDAQVKAKAFENLRAQLPAPTDLIQAPSGPSIGVVDLGNYYTSSLLVPHSAWAEVAARFDGKLLVAVPAPELLLFTSAADPDNLETLTGAAQKVFEQAPRGLSPTVLRWTTSGWIDAHQPPAQ